MDVRKQSERLEWSTLGRWTLCLAATLPFWLSLLFQMGGPRAQNAEAAQPRPALAFNQYLVNLGKVEPRREHFARFAFANTGEQSVQITELKPSCGCLRPHLEQRVYEPGESGEFFLRMRAAGEAPGEKEYYCDVLYNDPQPQRTRITFKLLLPKERITVRPKSLTIYAFSDKPTKRQILLTNYRDVPLRVQKVESSTNLVTATISDSIVDDAGNQQYVIEVTVGSVPPGQHQGTITIRTDAAQFPELEVPLRIQRLRDRG